MTEPPDQAMDTETAVDRVIADFIAAEESGQKPDPAKVIAQHPSTPADKSSLPVLEFLAKRQKRYQQQHLAALNAWRMWRRAQQQIGPVAKPAGSVAVVSDCPSANASPAGSNPAEQNEWLLPFPAAVAVDNTQQQLAIAK